MKMYKVSQFDGNEIREIEVDRVTKSSYWMDGGQRRKETEIEYVGETWTDAREWLQVRAEKELSKARNQAEIAKSTIDKFTIILSEVKAMKNPNEEDN